MHRVKVIQQWLKEHPEVAPLLIESPVDLFYLTGEQVSKGSLLVSARDTPLLTVDARYTDRFKNSDLFRVSGELNLPDRVTVDSCYTSVQRSQELQKKTDVSFLPRMVETRWRKHKDSREIERVKQASRLGDEIFREIEPLLKEGISEIELVKSIKSLALDRGVELSFDPIVAFGPHTAIPHHSPTSRALEKGEIILIDFGCKYEGYCSDATRLFSLGSISEGMQSLVLRVVHAMERILSLCRPGTPIKKLCQVCHEALGEPLIHGLGHGVGLEIHEHPALTPKSEEVLQSGMVLAVEPALYRSGEGGARIEYQLCITEGGCENFFQPRQPYNRIEE